MPTPEQIRQRKIYERERERKVQQKIAAGMTEEEAEEQIADGELQQLHGVWAAQLPTELLKRLRPNEQKKIEKQILTLHKIPKFSRFRNRLFLLLADLYISGRRHGKAAERKRHRRAFRRKNIR